MRGVLVMVEVDVKGATCDGLKAHRSEDGWVHDLMAEYMMRECYAMMMMTDKM